MTAPAGDSNVLTLSWVFGFSRDVAIQNLCDENRSAIFYVSAHTGIIHDITSRTQKLLQGHCNPISCTCVSADRRWIATADKGPESMVVIWDSYTGCCLPLSTPRLRLMACYRPVGHQKPRNIRMRTCDIACYNPPVAHPSFDPIPAPTLSSHTLHSATISLLSQGSCQDNTDATH